MKVTNPECYWLSRSFARCGRETVKRWLVRLGSVEAMFAAGDLTLLALPRFTPVLLAQLRTLTPERLEAEWQQLTQAGIRLLTWDDPTYPALLQRISSAPPVLFIQGEWWPTDESAVAILWVPDRPRMQACGWPGVWVRSGITWFDGGKWSGIRY